MTVILINRLTFKKITSAENPLIKGTIDVAKRRSKYRHEAFIIEGSKIIEAALSAKIEIKRVLFTEDILKKAAGERLLKKIAGITSELFEITEDLLDAIASTETPQGIIAVAEYNISSIETLRLKQQPLIVVIDGVQEPGNMGSIIRTSDAAGADAIIILPGSCEAFSQKTIRSTAGSIFNVPISFTMPDELISWSRSKGIGILVTDASGKDTIYEEDLTRPIALVFGNEAHGASNEMKRHSDKIVRIPIIGGAESLNVNASAAICLYEAVRQRGDRKAG